eukprot:5067629-Pyramimonas_sp.AAC.1
MALPNSSQAVPSGASSSEGGSNSQSTSSANNNSGSGIWDGSMRGPGGPPGAEGSHGRFASPLPMTPEQLVLDLTDPNTRENALLDLSKKREAFPDLAPILWHSFGVISALLQEIVSIYPLLSPPSLTAHASNRVCNALALLQCVASHPDTRALFLHGAFCAI